MPRNVFGEGALLNTFYQTMKAAAPGAWEINETMLAIWDPTAYSNEWVMPDNFHVIIKVMAHAQERVHFLNEPFDVNYSVNAPIEQGRSLGANTVHSLDGMVVREMSRRCTYDAQHIAMLRDLINRQVRTRSMNRDVDNMVLVLWGRFLESGFLSARILDYLDAENIGLVDLKRIKVLLDTFPKSPFEVISVHDCFRCLPNYGNDLRQQYNNILAEIAESNMLGYLVSQILGRGITVSKLDPTMGKDVRLANYALS
jgi:hypothetical protein